MKTIISRLILATTLLAPAAALADKANNSVIVGLARETDYIDRIHTESRESQFFSELVYDPLLYVDPVTVKLQGDLATAWRWIDDKTIEFDLRPGVKFHDGSPFTADDVLYTIAYVMDPNSKIRQAEADFGNIAGAEKTGPMQVRIHMKNPDPKAEFTFATRLLIWPKAYTEANGPEIHATKPIGTGPYKLTHMERGKEYILERNADFFGGPRPKPTLARIDAKVIPEIQTQIASLMAGAIDFSEDIPTDNAALLAANPALRVAFGKTTRYNWISMDSAGRTGDTPLKNVLVRQAIAAAIDKDSIATKLIGNGATALVAQCNPIQNLCVQDVPAQKYDPAKAKALLTQAGYAPGSITIPMISSDDVRSVSEAVQGQLAAVGIKLDYQAYPLPTWRDKFLRGQSTMSLLGWGGGGFFDVDGAMHIFYNGGPTDYARDAEMTKMLDQAAKTTDRAVREPLYKAILTRINDQAYSVPLYESGAVYAMSAGLDFQVPNTGTPDFTWAKWK